MSAEIWEGEGDHQVSTKKDKICGLAKKKWELMRLCSRRAFISSAILVHNSETIFKKALKIAWEISGTQQKLLGQPGWLAQTLPRFVCFGGPCEPWFYILLLTKGPLGSSPFLFMPFSINILKKNNNNKYSIILIDWLLKLFCTNFLY